jgi:hypothetical protein
MAWDNIPSNPIPAISIPEATLAGLTLSNYYLIGRYGNLFNLGATDPAAMTWTQLRNATVVGSVGKSTAPTLGDGYYVNPNQSDSLVINVQCAGLTTMAGTIQLTEMLSMPPLLAGQGVDLNPPGSPVTYGSDQAGVMDSPTTVTLAPATNSQIYFPCRPAAAVAAGVGLGRIWTVSLKLTALPTAGAFLNFEALWM